jgi:hypothetical protein
MSELLDSVSRCEICGEEFWLSIHNPSVDECKQCPHCKRYICTGRHSDCWDWEEECCIECKNGELE